MAVKLINTYEWNKHFYAMVDRGDGTTMELKSLSALKPEEWIIRAEKVVADEAARVAEQAKLEAVKELQDLQAKTQTLLAEKPIDTTKETVEAWLSRVVSEKTTAEEAPIGEVIK